MSAFQAYVETLYFADVLEDDDDDSDDDEDKKSKGSSSASKDAKSRSASGFDSPAPQGASKKGAYPSIKSPEKVSLAGLGSGALAPFASVQPESIMNRLVRLLIRSGFGPFVSMSMV